MEHQSLTGPPRSAEKIDTFASASLSPGIKALPNLASTPDALHLSPEDAIALRQQAERELNATLHAAAERVRYITCASGVAIALCENQEDEMVCRAGSGPIAPEVGTRMHIQSGITAESIRTRQTLRVDQASIDPRVNQETCRALGIESVMVMPLAVGRDVVGILELFGEQQSAFGERDAKTLQSTASGVQFALERALNAGFILGHIPWAVLADPILDAAPPIETQEVAGLLAADGTRSDAAISETSEMSEASGLRDQTGADEITLRTTVAFPTTSFGEKEEPEEVTTPEQAEAVPAFLARLADEARPTSTKRWNQWFRPQW